VLFYFTLAMKLFFFLFLLCSPIFIFAQSDSAVYYKNGTAAARNKNYSSIQKSIQKNLAYTLTIDTETDWEDGFFAIQLINYSTALVKSKISIASKQLSKQTLSFQKSFWTTCYKRFPIQFFTQAKNTIDTTKDYKLMALAGEYILADNAKLNYAKILFGILKQKFEKDTALFKSPHFISLVRSCKQVIKKDDLKESKETLSITIPLFLDKSYLPNNVIVFSFQRKNRNYLGLTIVRNQNGSFVVNEDGSYFNVPQLARSVNNLPSYLTSGNTPQGVFRMSGFGVSKLEAIGTTENLQLTLPVETTKQHFFRDSGISDNNWTIEDYEQILPKKWNGKREMYDAYYAGLAGRNEIIAHGTTINPEFYKNQPYYPHTPTEGCLCTKEIWSTVDGRRIESDQQKLINAVKKAGGPEGYLIVIELEDVQKPVTLKDVLPYLKQVK
jgi:hypothetical protein